MFIFIEATKHNSRWDCEARCEKQTDDSTDKWVLNTDYVIGINHRCLYLSRHIEGAVQVEPSSSFENEPHSFYIPLSRYHTVTTEIIPPYNLHLCHTLNRSKIENEG